MMETLYKNMGIVVGFLILILIVQQFLGDKEASMLVGLTLLGSLLLNIDGIVSMFENIFKSE